MENVVFKEDIIFYQGESTISHADLGGRGTYPPSWTLQSPTAFKLYIYDSKSAWYDEKALNNSGFPLTYNIRADSSGIGYVNPLPWAESPHHEGETYHYYNEPYRIEDLDITVKNITNFCSPGVEGRYEAYFAYFPKSMLDVDASDPLHSGTADPDYQRITWTPLYTVDWDVNPAKYCKQTCVNVDANLSASYNSNAVDVAYNSSIPFCCGDDINFTTSAPPLGPGPDCGKIANGIACLGTNLNPSTVAFALLNKYDNDEIGKIQSSACGNINVATDGTNWYRCGSFDSSVSAATANVEFNSLSTALFNDGVVQHEIICEQTNNVMYECVNSSTEPKLYSTNTVKNIGQSVKNISSESSAATTYYCTEKNNWRKDLDDPDYAITCDAAGFDWTGSMCCSEQEDANEFYNDPIFDIGLITSPGACWNSTYVREGLYPLDEQGAYNQEVLVINGTFLACDTTEYQYLINEKFGINPQLVENKPVCTLEKDLNLETKFFCNIQSGIWEELISIPTDHGIPDTQLIDEMHVSDSEPVEPGAGSQACCPAGDCWNGSVCVGNQADLVGGLIYNDLRCINGDWVEARQKWRWDLTVPGFCLNPDTQCLVDQQVGCIDAYQYACSAEGNCDYYCSSEGNWTTRTKYLAQQMKVFAEAQSGSYDLFCDSDISIVTNFVDYELKEVFPSVPPGVYAEDLLGNHCNINGVADQPCVSSMCVLKYTGGIAIGLTTNVENIEDITESPFRLFGETQSVCSTGAQATSSTSGAFEKCGTSNVWFNEKTRSIISVPQGTVPQRTVIQISDAFDQFFVDMIVTPFMSQIVPLGLESQFSFLDRASIMHALFFAHRQSQDVYAYYEGPRRYSVVYQSHIAMGMPQMGQDEEAMCDYLKEKSQTPVVCNPPNDYYVIDDDTFVNDFKNDVMAKLRVP